jgi:hypothetical protein
MTAWKDEEGIGLWCGPASRQDAIIAALRQSDPITGPRRNEVDHGV